MDILNLLVEGNLDETVGRRIAEYAGFTVSVVYGKKGNPYVKNKISGFNKSTTHVPMLALADLMDTGIECPPGVVESWLPRRSENLLLRIAVREMESWLLADRHHLAGFLKIPVSRVPDDPETLYDPKQSLINLARKSRSASVRKLLVPNQGSTATEGRAYTSEMQRFVRDHWNIEDASLKAPSLESCLKALRSLASRFEIGPA